MLAVSLELQSGSLALHGTGPLQPRNCTSLDQSSSTSIRAGPAWPTIQWGLAQLEARPRLDELMLCRVAGSFIFRI
ncbi:hypothetical protein DsansV1_C06g0060361 [Dioscorea sansibarensis]